MDDSKYILFYYEDEVKIIVPAYVIPEGSRVTKPTGEKVYLLHNEMKVYGNGEVSIRKSDNTRMLVFENQINIINDDDRLGWLISFEELFELMERQIDILESR